MEVRRIKLAAWEHVILNFILGPCLHPGQFSEYQTTAKVTFSKITFCTFLPTKLHSQDRNPASGSKTCAFSRKPQTKLTILAF